MSSSLTGLVSRDAARGRVLPPFCIFSARIAQVVRRGFGITVVIAVIGAAGCPVEPSDACRQYIACQTEYDEAAQTGPTEFSDYEDDGVCWDSAENAALCTERCDAAREALREAATTAGIDAPSCQ